MSSPQTPVQPEYEWALDAAIEALRALNAGLPAEAARILRDALWNAQGLTR